MRRRLEGFQVFSGLMAVKVTSALLVWLKRADSFVGLRKALTDKTKKRVFSLYLSPAFDIGACQEILELLNTRGHGWQRWCPCLLVSILVARRGFGQCVCINCLLESVHRAGSTQVNVKGYRKITSAHFQAFSESVWLCKRKRRKYDVWNLFIFVSLFYKEIFDN